MFIGRQAANAWRFWGCDGIDYSFCYTAVGSFINRCLPCFALSSFGIASLLRGKLKRSPNGLMFKRVLVVFQFTASVVLIICTIGVYKQIKHLHDQKVGIAIDQVLVVDAPQVISHSTFRQRVDFSKNELQQLSQGLKKQAVIINEAALEALKFNKMLL
jgi:hypothetical protein